MLLGMYKKLKEGREARQSAKAQRNKEHEDWAVALTKVFGELDLSRGAIVFENVWVSWVGCSDTPFVYDIEVWPATCLLCGEDWSYNDRPKRLTVQSNMLMWAFRELIKSDPIFWHTGCKN